jgi:hypothetical protein
MQNIETLFNENINLDQLAPMLLSGLKGMKLDEKEKEELVKTIQQGLPKADNVLKEVPEDIRSTVAKALRTADQDNMKEFRKLAYDMGFNPPAGWLEMCLPLYANAKAFFMQKGWKNRVVNGRNLACEAAVYTVLAILGVRWYQGRA